MNCRNISPVPNLNKPTPDKQSIFQFGSVVIIKWKNLPDFPIEYISPSCLGVFGYTDKEFVSGNIKYMDIVHKKDAIRVTDEVYKASACKLPYFEHDYYRVINKNGDTIWLKDNTTILYDDEGNIEYYLGYVIDITEPLHDKELLNLALYGSNMGYWDWKDNKGIFYSPSWYLLLGYKNQEFEPSMDVFYSMIHPEDRDRVKHEIEACISILDDVKCNFTDIEFRIQCKDNSYKWILSRGNVVEFGDNLQPTRMAGVHIDITDRKNYIKDLELYNKILISNNKHTMNLVHSNANWDMIPNVIQDFGEILEIDRICIFEKNTETNQYEYFQSYEWTNYIFNENNTIPIPIDSVKSWNNLFDRGELVGGVLNDFPELEKNILKNRSVKSTIMYPITSNTNDTRKCWGFISFEDCSRGHVWSSVEVNALELLSILISLIITDILQTESHYSEINFLKKQLRNVISSQDKDIMALRNIKADLDSTSIIQSISK